jgi:D-proline reductase (dithiol) PrdB
VARLEDVPTGTRAVLEQLECPSFERKPFVSGPPLASRRIAVVSSAGLFRRGDRPFLAGEGDYRALPAGVPARDILMSHVSVNFDRTGFQRDMNIVLPLDRLRELAEDGAIGSVAETHYAFMGATDPKAMEPRARALAGLLKADGVGGVVLTPV